jgi:phthiocerol/phenolphthiocerol synthesis type-I polyketide synthase C
MTVVASQSVAVLGLAARLPGASGLDELWTVLCEGRSTVSDTPPSGRWRAERFLSPDRAARGMAYTFAGGYLADPYAFDAAAFGFSPREAAQMDPQQRLLLEVTWEALEDAGLPPSSLRGGQVGVYIGASATDYADLPLLDLGAIEPHFMVGNSLSILSNRISYVYDFRGPSLTVDTACSSSLAALTEALRALEAGAIDLAVVGGVNVFSSPAPFIGFSRAGMLSPTGRCRPFSARADGYVRSEGAIVVILGRADEAGGYAKPRALIRAAGLNSDGRTNGISMPSVAGQRALITQLYADAAIHPNTLAFVEAHGTGTRVGDPIEAEAIGLALGSQRPEPLPIGSIKSNIGHLEAASGLAGLAKAVLALEHRVLPATLHLDEINPEIAIDRLGLRFAGNAIPLPSSGPLRAGLSNFGFGGTNAHVILESAPDHELSAVSPSVTNVLALSAHTRDALQAIAGDYAQLLGGGGACPKAVATEALHTRDTLRHCAVVDLAAPGDISKRLTRLSEGRVEAGVVVAEATASAARTLFVFSGNGSQWPGMGRAAYAGNAVFRSTFDDIAARIRAAGGICPLATMHADDASLRLRGTTAAQPLLFAIQIALTEALRAAGLQPDAVLGHSVGEIAAATVSGAIGLDDAVTIVVQRSARQEAVRALGGMAVLACDAERASLIIAEARVSGIEIAARNGPSSTTLSGPTAALNEVLAAARSQRLPGVLLDIDYPFHHSLLEPEKQAVQSALLGIEPAEALIPFFSSVTGTRMSGRALDAAYWWSNLREPVLFETALTAALGEADLVVEISPRPILGSVVADVVRSAGRAVATLATLTQEDVDDIDPVRQIALEAMARGAVLDHLPSNGARYVGPRCLPRMRWNHQQFLIDRTSEAFDLYGRPFAGEPLHPLVGTRVAPGGVEWRHVISLETLPFLSGHRVDGEVVFPATGYIEALLAIGRDVYGKSRLRIEDFDVVRAMVLEPGVPREISATWSEADRLVEIRSRRRFDPSDSFVLHARGTVGLERGTDSLSVPDLREAQSYDRAAVYAAAAAARLAYDGAFRAVTGAWTRDGLTVADISPVQPDLGAFSNVCVVNPAAFDAGFHALFLGVIQTPGRVQGELPVRIDTLCLLEPGVDVCRAVAVLRRETAGARIFDVVLLSEGGRTVARAEGLVMRRVTYAAWNESERVIAVRACAAERSTGLNLQYLLEALGSHPGPDAQTVAAYAAVASLALDVAAEVVGELAGHQFSPTNSPTRLSPAADAQCVWHALLEVLRESGRLEERDGTASLRRGTNLIGHCRSLLEQHPTASVELRLALHALEILPRLLRGQLKEAGWNEQLGEAFLAHSVFTAPALDGLVAAIERCLAIRKLATLEVGLLEPGLTALLPRLLLLARAGLLRLYIISGDRTAAEAVIAAHGGREFVSILDLDAAVHPQLDLVACVANAALNGGAPSPLDLLARSGLDRQPLLIAAPAHHPAIDVLHAGKPGWFDLSVRPDLPVGAWPLPSETDEALAGAGFRLAGQIQAGVAGSRLLLLVPSAAEEPPRAQMESPDQFLALSAGEARDGWLRAALGDCGVVFRDDIDALRADAAQQHAMSGSVVVLDHGPDDVHGARDAVEARVLRLRAIAMTLATGCPGSARLYVVCEGIKGTSEAVATFSRCLMNEFPEVEVCIIRLVGPPAPGQLAGLVRDHIAAPLVDRELRLSPDGPLAERAAPAAPRRVRARETHERTVMRMGGAPEDLLWVVEPRRTPRPGEVEVEVEATALNFRDVMLCLGLLDDAILGDGLTSGAVGFEFAGRVRAVGAEASAWQVGDLVMGFGSGAFASHIYVPASNLARVPSGLGTAAAAAIPVAFVTAWYSLVDKAALRTGETVLIHGAAGGVGLAAVQIAKMHGARVIALAGTAEKRRLLSLLGADIVLDSRAASWPEDVRAAVGGVDVALNSVFGDAMRTTLRLVKPFGRFIELGKRDFLENTRIATRPFVRNVSYFGVDVDQLLAHAPEFVQGIIEKVVNAFEAGLLHALPLTTFAGREVASAMRLMQASGHLGKIIVRPAKSGEAPPPRPPRFVPRRGAHVVLGGTGGFGLAAALWLAEQGAETVIVASRRGEIEAAQAARVEALRTRGVQLLAERVDVTCQGEVAHAFARWRAAHGGIAGVMHAAMVLDDGLIASLSQERLAAVLAPKIDGMCAVREVTRTDELQYLVAFSSAATLIGSPGQGAYVAANGFLEGAVAELRAEGVPALAICWGAISDAGVVHRATGLAERLRQTTGVGGVSAAEALAHLGTLLADPWEAPPVSTYTALHRSPAARKLVTLRGAFLADVVAPGTNTAEENGGGALDLAALSPEVAASTLCLAVCEEVARILRLPVTAVDPDQQLIEAGLDSLMALELRLALERRAGVELPMLALGGDRSARQLADRILALHPAGSRAAT